MIVYRLFTSWKRGRGPTYLKTNCLICQGYREAHESKRLSPPKESPFLWTPLESISERLDTFRNARRILFLSNNKCSPVAIGSIERNNVFSKKENSCMDSCEATSGVNNHPICLSKNSYITAIEETLMCPKRFEVESYHIAPSKFSNQSNKTNELVGENRKKNGKYVEKMNKNLNYFSASKSHRLRMTKVRKIKKLAGTEELILQNVMDGIVVEWPNWFENKASLNTAYVSDSILFDNAVLGIKTKGIQWYKLQLYCFKWAAKIVWSEPKLEILQITKHPEDSTIKVRWLANGKPRLLYPLILLGRTPSLRYMDFFSILKIGQDEKIDAHKLTKLVPRQSMQKRNPLISLLTLFGLAGRSVPEFQEKPILPSSGQSSGC